MGGSWTLLGCCWDAAGMLLGYSGDDKGKTHLGGLLRVGRVMLFDSYRL
jgi:hypothetical protein